LLAALSMAGAAWPNLVINGSFEEGAFVPNGHNLMQLGAGSTAITGWTVVQSGLAWVSVPNAFGGTASAGIRCLDLTDYIDAPPYGGVSQSITTEAGVGYRVSFDLGTHSEYTSIAGIRVSAAGSSQIFTELSSAGQRWDTEVWTFVATNSMTTIELVGTQSAPAYIGLDNVIVERLGPMLNGHVDLTDFEGSPLGRLVVVDVSSGGASETRTARLDGAGSFTVALAVPPGTYTVGVKASHWLRKATPGVVLTQVGPNSVSATLPNGDVDDDNEVSIGDYSLFSIAFNANPGDPHWNPETDLNGDEGVDIGDFAILSANYGLVGD